MDNMALDIRQSSPVSFRSPPREPYSYAAERALSEREPSLEELEAAVKETPPRPTSTIINGHVRNSSEPRSLGDVMDEGEKMLPPGSPSLRHIKGRLENDIRPKSPNESFASVAKHDSGNADDGLQHNNTPGKHNIPVSGYKSPSDFIKREHDKDDDATPSDKSAHAGRRESSLKQRLQDARSKPESSAKSESFADVAKHDIASQDTGHSKDIKQEPGEQAKLSGVQSESAQHPLRFPDIPKNDPVSKNKTSEPASFPDVPEHGTVKQEESHQSINLPDLPEHEPNASLDSYANVVKHEPTSPVLRPQAADGGVAIGDQKPSTANADQSTTETVSQQPDETSKTSTSAKNAETIEDADGVDANTTSDNTRKSSQQDTADDSRRGSLIYENYESRSGTNLASIMLGKEYDLAMSQRENKAISSKDSDKENAEDKGSGSTLVSGRQAGAGWSRSAVRWAPLNVPLQRRLQTLAVLGHSLSIASFVAFFFFLCAIPIFWPIIVPYLIYVLLSSAGSDGKLAHRSEYLRRSKFWSLFASYFPARLHRSVELEPNRKYIFGYHPHGIISHGAFAAFATEALGFSSLFPGITNSLLTLDSNFRIPLYRDWILRLGLASVARESCENILSRGGPNGQGMGRAITIVVGGARESLDAKPGTLNLVLAKRKGFVKLAVRTGADLVPVLAFGENDMYDQIGADTHPWIHKWQLLVKRFMGFTLPLFHARGIFNYDVGIMPYRRPVNIVVGRPIQTKIAKNPDPAYVNELHKQYTDELMHLWNEWKDTFAPDRKAELQIVE